MVESTVVTFAKRRDASAGLVSLSLFFSNWLSIVFILAGGGRPLFDFDPQSRPPRAYDGAGAGGSPVTYLLVAPGIEPARIAHATACLLATAVYLERRARHAEKEFLINDQAQW